METVSIIMPCYNDGQYIEEAVASLRAQTYAPLELILVDDGSDDSNTLKAINHLQFPHLKKLHTNHIGPSAARNHGIAAAQGKYILPLDADDKIEPTYVEKAVAILEEKQEIGIVYCYADFWGKRTGPWQLPEYTLKEMLLGNVIFTSAMFRKADWTEAGGYRTAMESGLEDYDFWLSLLELGREVYQIPEVLFHYRIKAASRSTKFQSNMEGVQEAYRQLYNNHQAFYQKHCDMYIMALREKNIDQTFTIDRLLNNQILLERLFPPIKALKGIPWLKKMIRKRLQGGKEGHAENEKEER